MTTTTNEAIKWSKYQEAFFDAYKNTNQNIVIMAGPGSGKTTTGIAALNIAHHRRKRMFSSFSRAITNELKHRAPEGVNVATLHSIGRKAITSVHPYPDVNPLKKAYTVYGDFVKKALHLDRIVFGSHAKVDIKKWKKDMAAIQDLTEKWRLGLCQNEEDLMNMLDAMGKGYDVEHIVIMPEVMKLLDEYNNMSPGYFGHGRKYLIDFVDMLYLPIVRDDMVMEQYDEVFLDEAQDANIPMQKLVRKALKKHGRFIAIGDKRQSIYGFIGSDPKAFDNFLMEPNTIDLQLPVSYRCSKAVVRHAQEIWPGIEYHEGSPEGAVYNKKDVFDHAEPGDFVLCRNNKPLFYAWLEFLRVDKTAFIRDRELGQELYNLVENFRYKTGRELMDHLDAKADKILNDLKGKTMKNGGVIDPFNHPRYRNFCEKQDIVQKLLEVSNFDTNRLADLIGRIFDDKQGNRAIQLMTCHKSKGLEANNVTLIMPDLIGAQVKTEDNRVQEQNLKFVAVTRAKDTFAYDPDFEMLD